MVTLGQSFKMWLICNQQTHFGHNESKHSVISCLSQQYSSLYLSPTLPTLLPASNIPNRCTIGCLLPLGARGQLPSRSMLSTWRVLKQFTQLLPSGFFENFIQNVPIMCLSHSLWVLSKSTHQSDQKVPTGFISM